MYLKLQWSYCLEMPNSGSIYCISWSSDGTQLACACANGNLLLAHTIERYFKNFLDSFNEN